MSSKKETRKRNFPKKFLKIFKKSQFFSFRNPFSLFASFILLMSSKKETEKRKNAEKIFENFLKIQIFLIQKRFFTFYIFHTLGVPSKVTKNLIFSKGKFKWKKKQFSSPLT